MRLAALLALIALQAGCGGSDETERAATGSKPAVKPAKLKAGPAGEDALANAVVVGKAVAPVMLKYDLAVKPEAGQPFEIALTFLPRQVADALEADVSGMSGLTIENGGTIRFEGVENNGRYVAKVLANADAQGLYYIGIVARMVTKVQTESRSFSIPVVVGKPTTTALEKPAAATDAQGEPVESMPAKESVSAPSDN
jgi:hypothetical protein